MNMISAVILASGQSKRMGVTKQLLSFNGTTLLGECIKNVLLCPFDEVIAIIGHDAAEIKENIFVNDERFRWEYNKEYRKGKSNALKLGASKVCQSSGIFVFLGDHPLIKTKTINALYRRAKQLLPNIKEGLVIQPSFNGQTGHPVFFSHHLFSYFELLNGDEGGIKIIQKAHQLDLVQVDDEGILLDIDTPAEYEWLLNAEAIK